jgi:hypothetical protein
VAVDSLGRLTPRSVMLDAHPSTGGSGPRQTSPRDLESQFEELTLRSGNNRTRLLGE